MEQSINENWTKIDNSKIEDLESYILNQLAKKASIIIGTDSMLCSYSKPERHRVIKYLTVIVFKSKDENFRDVNHVIKRHSEQIKFGKVPTAVKLNGEINRTSELALWFRDTVKFDPEIHLDLNPSDKFGSFEVYNYIKGYFESMGFNCYYKPNSAIASFAADYYL